jgi:hypothetical protein
MLMCRSKSRNVTRIDDATKVGENNLSSFAPILDGEVLNIDLPLSFGGFVGIHHLDGGFIIFMNWGGIQLSKSKLSQDRAKVFCNLGRGDGRDKFCLGASREHESVASSRAPVTKIVAMSGINVTNEVQVDLGERKGREHRIKSESFQRKVWESRIGSVCLNWGISLICL